MNWQNIININPSFGRNYTKNIDKNSTQR